jgi:hypothetical protein
MQLPLKSLSFDSPTHHPDIQPKEQRSWRQMNGDPFASSLGACASGGRSQDSAPLVLGYFRSSIRNENAGRVAMRNALPMRALFDAGRAARLLGMTVGLCRAFQARATQIHFTRGVRLC